MVKTRAFRFMQEDSHLASVMVRMWLYRILFEVLLPAFRPGWRQRRFMLYMAEAYYISNSHENASDRRQSIKRCNLHAQKEAWKLGGTWLWLWSLFASVSMTSPWLAVVMVLAAAAFPFVFLYLSATWTAALINETLMAVAS